jgi:hypothetical protein
MQIRNAITACAVMAFSLNAAGQAIPCEQLQVGTRFAALPKGSHLLAASAELDRDLQWVRVLHRNGRFSVESNWPRARSRRIDAGLAKYISARLTTDVQEVPFQVQTEEIYLDAPWRYFSADGAACAATDVFTLNERGRRWTLVFAALASDVPSREAIAWFWLDQLEMRAATLPTSLSGMTADHAVIGAASVWSHAGVEPLRILSHRATTGYGGDTVLIVGELANDLNSALAHTKVVATFFGSDGTEIGTEDAFVELSRLPARARSPFMLLTRQTNIASYTLRIDPGATVTLHPSSIRITHHDARNVDGELVVRGSLRNDGKVLEQSVTIHLNLYDAAGRLLDNESEDLRSPLAAGASASFEVTAERTPDYHHYSLIVDPEYRERGD